MPPGQVQLAPGLAPELMPSVPCLLPLDVPAPPGSLFFEGLYLNLDTHESRAADELKRASRAQELSFLLQSVAVPATKPRGEHSTSQTDDVTPEEARSPTEAGSGGAPQLSTGALPDSQAPLEPQKPAPA